MVMVWSPSNLAVHSDLESFKLSTEEPTSRPPDDLTDQLDSVRIAMIHNAEGAVGLAHEILRGLHRQLVHFWVFAGVSGSVEDQLTAKYFDCPSYGCIQIKLGYNLPPEWAGW